MAMPVKLPGSSADPRQHATVAVPWGFAAGRTATVAGAAKVRQFLETYLFTGSGERVNRPTYGAGVVRLVFNAATQVEQTLRHGIQGGLTQEMLDLIDILGVDSEVVEATVRVTVRYRLRLPGPAGGGDRQVTFDRPFPG
jgi:hypothetical protein